MSEQRQPRGTERGFTLVELMVVVAIIALLAAIIIPNYVHSRASAAVAQSEANLKEIATSLELYYTDNQQYPASCTPVAPNCFTKGNAGAGGTTQGNPYLNATPVNALNRGTYTYTLVPGAGQTTQTYTITDTGPYDSSTMTSIPLDPATGGGGQCKTCTALWYSPQAGIYGK